MMEVINFIFDGWSPIYPFFKAKAPVILPQPIVVSAVTVPVIVEEPKPRRNILAVGKHFEVDCDKFAEIGERDVILAKSGMGKSYLSGLLMEETLENDGVICVIDPQNETYTLAWEYDSVVVVGGDGQRLVDEYAADAQLPKEEQQYTKKEREIGTRKALERIPLVFQPMDYMPQPGDTKEEKTARQSAKQDAIIKVKDQIEQLIERMLVDGISLIFDQSGLSTDDRDMLFCLIADSLCAQQNKRKRKMRFVVEEAQLYAPQKGKSLSRERCIIIAKQGRKDGIDSIFGTQRPAAIDKDVISQANRFWFGGLTAQQDHKAVKGFLEEAGIDPAELGKLKQGEFYYSESGKPPELMETKKRKCRHAGATPKTKRNHKVAGKADVQKILSQFKASTEQEENG